MVRGRYWSSGYTEGIRQETAKIKGRFTEITPDELDRVREDALPGQRPLVIVNCISRAWTGSCLELLGDTGIHPLLLTPFGWETPGDYSTVSLDFYTTYLSLFHYLSRAGRRRIALLGMNPDSVNDTVKRRAFAAYQRTPPEDTAHIFWNHGSLQDCCARFCAQREAYDAVVCTNDVVAIKLIALCNADNIRVPEDLWVAAMGNTLLSGFISPQITVAEMDCPAIGRQAVRLYAFLRRNPGVSSLRAVTPGRIIVRASTGSVPDASAFLQSAPSRAACMNSLNFYADADVSHIFWLENLFRNCEETDRRILMGILCGKTYAALAEEIFLSERAVKYRVHRMVKLAGCRSREELTAMLTQYID